MEFLQGRRSALTAALCATVTVAASLASAAPSAALAPPSVTVSGATPAHSTVTLAGTQLGTATVSLRLQVPAGQASSFTSGGAALAVPALVGPGLARAPLTLVSGDRTDGVWRATLVLGAHQGGTHALSVAVCPSGWSCVANGPVVVAAGADVTVHGSNAPLVTERAQAPARSAAGVRTARLVGRVQLAASRTPVAGLVVRLVRHAPTGSTVAHTGATDAQGRFDTPWPWPDPAHHVRWTVTVGRSQPTVGSVTYARLALGYPATRFALGVRSATSTPVGVAHPVTGTVAPGTPAATLGPVLLQRREGGLWRTIARSGLRPTTGTTAGRASTYRFGPTFAASGTFWLRVVKPGALCLPGGWCRVAAAVGRPFSVVAGSTTYRVEARLHAMGYPTGPVDGVGTVRTRQALCAWREMTGLPHGRYAMTAKDIASVLAARSAPTTTRSDGLYVNKQCLVVYQVVAHHNRRIAWVSTGMPGMDTPNGVGRVWRKQAGWAESTLYPGAYMLDSLYFRPDLPNFALHGSVTNAYVLPYPASHGCVRVWRPTISAIFDETPLGAKVVVYGAF